AALDAASGVVTPWNANADGGVDVMLLSGSTLYLAGTFNNVGGQIRAQNAALDVPTATATPFMLRLEPHDQFFIPFLSDIAVIGPTAYICGHFIFCNGQQ